MSEIIVIEYKKKLETTPHNLKGQVVQEMGSELGWSTDKCYRSLKKQGWTSGRKKRADKGTTGEKIASLEMLAAMLKQGVRKNGKQVLDIPTARSILSQNNVAFNVTNTQLARLLKQLGLSAKALKRPEENQSLRTLYPNQVHQVDPSLCLIYYLPKGGQKIIADDEAYKNKPFMEGKERLKVWRYVLTDHYSSTIYVRYYQSKGESQANLYDFLLNAWAKKEDNANAFHGVPEQLLWDSGSANTSKAVANALEGLGVLPIVHMPGKPRVKGQVENANNLVEKLFESRLRFEPALNLNQLNGLVENWCVAYNNNTLPAYDSTLTRNGKKIGVRQELWLRITEERLRLLPPAELCRNLLTHKPTLRKVAGDMTITFSHPVAKKSWKYSLADVIELSPGQEVSIAPNLFTVANVFVIFENLKGSTHKYEIKPIAIDEAGFMVDAPVIGKEHKAKPTLNTEKKKTELEEKARPTGKEKTPFQHLNEGKGLDATSHLATVSQPKNVSILPKKGREIELPSTVSIAPVTLTVAGACKLLKQNMGENWQKQWYSQLKKQYPQGIEENTLPTIEAELRKTTTTPKLKLVFN